MPRQGKSRRIAARQTQMGQKKRRHVPGPSGIPITTDAPPAKEDGSGTTTAAFRRPDVARPTPMETPRPSPARRGEHLPSVYSYVGPELKRIMLLAAGVVVVLILLSFVLG